MIATSVQTENATHNIGSMPAYRLGPDGQAVVTVDGVDQSLGRYGSEASRRRYLVILASLQSNGFLQQTIPASIANYRSLKARKERERAEREEQERLRKEIKEQQRLMRLELRLSRQKRLEQRRLAEEKSRLEREKLANRLSALVDDYVVESTIKQLSPVLRDMVRLQKLLGCEPAELCGITPGDVTRKGGRATIELRVRRTSGRILIRTVELGKDANAILEPYLDRPADQVCFSPRESVLKMREERHRHRKRKDRFLMGRAIANHKRVPGVKYESGKYGESVRLAAIRAFPIPDGLTSDQVDRWIEKYHWHPRQLAKKRTEPNQSKERGK